MALITGRYQNYAIIPSPDPVVITSPVNCSAVVGGEAHFSVMARGTGSLTYQWRRDGTPLSDAELVSGANSATLSLLNVGMGDQGNYDVIVASSVGTITSAGAYLTVQAVTPLIDWPSPLAINYGVALSAEQLNAVADVPGNFSYSPIAGTVLSAGSQTLNVTFTPLDNVNYSTVTSNQTLLVNKTALTATADDQTRTEGSPNPPLTISYVGFVNGDTEAVIITPIPTTVATESSVPGTYTISLGGGNADNYHLTLVNGTLTVTTQFASWMNRYFSNEELNEVSISRPSATAVQLRAYQDSVSI